MDSVINVEDITNEFGSPESPKKHIVPKSLVKKWMSSPDIEVQGVVSGYILDNEYTSRIEPNLTFNEVHKFVMSYFERCLLEDPDGDWADSDYEAAYSLVNWFNYLWSEREKRKAEIDEFKSWLGDLYKNGDQRLQTCIVNGIVEHLFEDKQIKSFFRDWKEDSVLEKAFDEGSAWSK